jgi:hypothetical protein
METEIKQENLMTNPSLNDLEHQLLLERRKLKATFGTDEERHGIISRIRMLRSSIDMLKGYMEHFQPTEMA